EGRRSDQTCTGIFLGQGADNAGIQRVRMKHDSRSQNGRQANSHRKTEGVEERKYAQDAVVLIQGKYLAHLLDVGGDVEVRQHYALGVAGRAAGKNHRGQIVDAGSLTAAEVALQ